MVHSTRAGSDLTRKYRNRMDKRTSFYVTQSILSTANKLDRFLQFFNLSLLSVNLISEGFLTKNCSRSWVWNPGKKRYF